MKTSELMVRLQESIEDNGDLEVLILDGNNPVSHSPRPRVEEAFRSSWGYTIPANIYYNSGNRKVQEVLYL